MPTKVAGTLVFKRIDGGNSDHACGVTTDGSAYCWGANSSGMLGNNMTSIPVRMPVAVSTAVKFVSAKPGDLFTCGLGTDAKIYCWGDNATFQLGNGKDELSDQLVPGPIASTETFKDVAVGLNFACGLTTTGTVLCWGNTRNGQLGRGVSNVTPGATDRSTPTAVMGGLTFAALAAGSEHACAITTAGAAYCWGFNTRAEVGDGTNMVCPVPTAVTGGLTFATP
jgi:alpha-tubulin suppressor-like RCC1 family protein